MNVFLYSFLINPFIRYVINRADWLPVSRVLATVSALLLVAIATILQYLYAKEPNYYEYFNVTPFCSLAELTAAYRRLAVAYHPDKNTSPHAADIFSTMKFMYDVLRNDDARYLYNTMGPDLVESGVAFEDNGHLYAGIAVFYSISLVMTYIMTWPSSAKSARTLCICILLTWATFEVYMIQSGESIAIPFFSYLAVFEQIAILRSLYSVVLHIAVTISASLYIDCDAVVLHGLRAIFELVSDNKRRIDILLSSVAELEKKSGMVISPQLAAELKSLNHCPNKFDGQPIQHIQKAKKPGWLRSLWDRGFVPFLMLQIVLWLLR